MLCLPAPWLVGKVLCITSFGPGITAPHSSIEYVLFQIFQSFFICITGDQCNLMCGGHTCRNHEQFSVSRKLMLDSSHSKRTDLNINNLHIIERNVYTQDDARIMPNMEDTSKVKRNGYSLPIFRTAQQRLRTQQIAVQNNGHSYEPVSMRLDRSIRGLCAREIAC